MTTPNKLSTLPLVGRFFSHHKKLKDSSLYDDLQNLQAIIATEISGKKDETRLYGQRKITAINKLLSALNGDSVRFTLEDDYKFHLKTGRIKDILNEYKDDYPILKNIITDGNTAFEKMIDNNLAKMGF